MKEILIITPYCPFPPHKSGGIHALYSILKENKYDKNTKIDLLYYDEEDKEAEIEIKRYINDVRYVDLRRKGKFNRIISILKRIPYGVYQYDECRLNLEKKYDLIILDQSLGINIIKNIKQKNVILMAYDSMQLYFKRKSQIDSQGFISKIYNLSQSYFYKKLQGNTYDMFNKIYFVSENDSDFEKSKNPKYRDKLDFINLGVDFEKFSKDRYEESKEDIIVFTGIMSYAPNKDAAIYFAKDIMPKILEKRPKAKFLIVGKDPDEDILALRSDNIKVTGFVNDIVEVISSAKIYVSPLRFGTGMKNKVLEAMSTSKAIVASEVSIEGIKELIHNENIYIAKNDEEWVTYVCDLIDDTNKNKIFGEKCREVILQNYNWKKSYNKIIE